MTRGGLGNSAEIERRRENLAKKLLLKLTNFN